MFLAIKKNTFEVINNRQSSHNDSPEYKDRRLAALVKHFGGQTTDYELIVVPSNDEDNAMNALYITFNGESLTYHMGARFLVENGIITINKQWIKGQNMLTNPDETEFTSLAEDTYFSLDAYENNSTKEITIELFLWGATENKGDGPSGKTFCTTICSGEYHHATQTFTFN